MNELHFKCHKHFIFMDIYFCNAPTLKGSNDTVTNIILITKTLRLQTCSQKV